MISLIRVFISKSICLLGSRYAKKRIDAEFDAGTFRMKILVVEDDQSVRETLGMVLEAYDHQPDLVDDGEQALVYLESHWPEVMLLDLSLPGMSGEEVYAEIRRKFGRVPPTVVVSAVQQGEERVRGLPGALFLPKPYTIDDLAKILEDAAKARRAA